MDKGIRSNLGKIIEDTVAVNNKDISDYYFASGTPPSVVEKGVLRKLEGDVDDVSIFEFLKYAEVDPDRAVHNLPYDFAFTLIINGERFRFRGNIDRRWQGLDLTVRLLPKNIKTLDELGLPKYLYKLMDMRQGIVLVCGPTGSGKSTTMASLIEHVNQNQEKKIVTIEDPIEYVFEEKKSIISQREVPNGNSFLPYLKAALRQRPNIIVVGEVRDAGTAEFLLKAAETGHLVISTLHTVSTQQTLTRLTNAIPSDIKENAFVVLSNILRAVIVQKLFLDRKNIVRAAYEICMVDSSIQQAIRSEKFHQILNYMQYKQSVTGSISMNEVLRDFVDKEYITLEEALKLSYDTENLK